MGEVVEELALLLRRREGDGCVRVGGWTCRCRGPEVGRGGRMSRREGAVGGVVRTSRMKWWKLGEDFLPGRPRGEKSAPLGGGFSGRGANILGWRFEV